MVQRFVIVIALIVVAAGCSDDPVIVGPSENPFTEGLTFALVVQGAWSADREDPQGRTQGQIRVSVANQSQVWLGSDAMSHIGETPEEERYRTTVRFGDLQPGVVVVRIAFQHYDGSTDKQIITTLKEITTIGDQPIEIKDGQITDLGTVEVTIPTGTLATGFALEPQSGCPRTHDTAHQGHALCATDPWSVRE